MSKKTFLLFNLLIFEKKNIIIWIYSNTYNFIVFIEFAELVTKGHRPDIKGVKMSDEYRNLMERCWDQKPEARPSAKDIKNALSDMFKRLLIKYKD